MATGNIDYSHFDKLKVLVAEDNLVNQFLAKSTLESWGATVDVAANGLEALALHEQHNYDLILMDIQMPYLDGLEATKRIRQSPDEQKAHVPIIALTANALNGDQGLYLAAGMNGFVSKPYEEEKLFQTIVQALHQPLAHRREAANQMTATDTKTALYSLAHIQALSHGNAAFVQRMLQVFLQNVPRQLQDLQQSLQAHDWVKVNESAHNLKTSIDVMLVTSLQEDIRFVELHARNKTHLNEIPPVVGKVVRVLELILGQVRQHLSRETQVPEKPLE